MFALEVLTSQVLVLGVFRSEMLVLLPAALVLGPEMLVAQVFILKVLASIVSVLSNALEYSCNHLKS